MPDYSFNEEDVDLSLEEGQDEDSKTPVLSTLAADVEMEGRLKLRYGIEVAGAFKGTLRSNSNVKVLSSGQVEGNVDAYNVSIEGKIHAAMIAKKRLEVLKDGQFIGNLDIQPERIVLSEYATFGQNEDVAKRYHDQFSRERTAKAAAEHAALVATQKPQILPEEEIVPLQETPPSDF